MPTLTGELCPLIDLVSFDEKKFVLDFATKSIFVASNDDEALFHSYTGQSALSVMVMGAYDKDGPGPIVFLEEGDKVSASSFAAYLRRYLLPFFVARGKKVGIFDNAPPHKGCARAVYGELGLVCSDHPANSPEVNPVELVWNRMVNMVMQNIPWGTRITKQIFQREIRRAWAVCAGPGMFEKDMMHVAAIMAKIKQHDGGNMF